MFSLILCLLTAIGFGIIALLVVKRQIAPFDNTIISFVQGFESPVWTQVMKFFTLLGSTPFVFICSLITLFLLYKIFKHRTELIVFITAMAGSIILNQVLKHLFHRARPVIHRLIEERGYSFPSGHSMMSVTFYGILAVLLWRHIPNRTGRNLLVLVAALLVVAVGTSRIYLGVHYPSDVLGGYLVSGFWLSVVIFFYQKLQASKKVKLPQRRDAK